MRPRLAFLHKTRRIPFVIDSFNKDAVVAAEQPGPFISTPYDPHQPHAGVFRLGLRDNRHREGICRWLQLTCHFLLFLSRALTRREKTLRSRVLSQSRCACGFPTLTPSTVPQCKWPCSALACRVHGWLVYSCASVFARALAELCQPADSRHELLCIGGDWASIEESIRSSQC